MSEYTRRDDLSIGALYPAKPLALPAAVWIKPPVESNGESSPHGARATIHVPSRSR